MSRSQRISGRILCGLVCVLASGCQGELDATGRDVAGGNMTTVSVSNSVGTGTQSSPSGSTGTSAPGSNMMGTSPVIPMDPKQCETAQVTLGVTPMQRLSQHAFGNTLRDLFGKNSLDDIVPQLESTLALHPKDGSGVRFLNMDRRISQEHIDSQFRVASLIGDELAKSPQKRGELLGACAQSEVLDQGCVQEVLERLGPRVLRRALMPEDKDRYLAMMQIAQEVGEKWRALLVGLLMSPEFNYHLESERGEGAGEVGQVDSWALANRLSYLFWRTMPDEALFRAAADGSLLKDEVYEAQVDRLFDHPRTRQTIESFYAQLYHLKSIPKLSAQDPVFQAMTQGGLEGVLDPERDFTGAMRKEIEDLTSYYTFDKPGRFEDLWTTTLSFASTEDLALIYGTAVWDGVSDPPQLPASQRSGLLTRAAFLVSGLSETSPIHRGVHVYRDQLCGIIPSPDPNTLPEGALVLPKPDGTTGTREVVQKKTGINPCIGCHQQFNGYGYVLERYDALGRFRDEEIVYARTGDELGRVAVNPQTSVFYQGKNVDFDGPGTMSGFIGQDKSAHECFAKSYFQFAYGRVPTREDACGVSALSERLQEGTLRDAFRSVALSSEFKLRHVEQ